MMTALFLVEKFVYEKMAEQLAALVNRMENISVTVQVLQNGEKYRELFAGHITYKAESQPYWGVTILSETYLYHAIIREKYDAAIAWTEGKCVRILSGCPYSETKLYCMIRTDLSESGKFTTGFHSWGDARNAYRQMDCCLVSDEALIKPFCSVSDVAVSRVETIPPLNETRGMRKNMNWRQYCIPGTLQICSAGENLSSREIRHLFKIHTQLLAEGYWHRMIVIGGKKRKQFSRDTFVHLPYDKNTIGITASCDIFLSISGEASALDALTDALQAGVPAVATGGILAQSMVEQGNKGIVTENNVECIKTGLRNMLTKPNLRYICAKNAGKTTSDKEEKSAVRKIEKILREGQRNAAKEVTNNSDNIKANRGMCYNKIKESGTVFP